MLLTLIKYLKNLINNKINKYLNKLINILKVQTLIIRIIKYN